MPHRAFDSGVAYTAAIGAALMAGAAVVVLRVLRAPKQPQK